MILVASLALSYYRVVSTRVNYKSECHTRSGLPGGRCAMCRARNIAIMGRRPPGFFWLFAIGELVSNKPCAILAASW